MSRLASSARDFAIACLARGDWMSAEDALSLAGELDAASALQQHHPYRSFDFGPDIVEPRIVWRGDRRVGVRVALYLRCLRRAEARAWWEGESDERVCCADGQSWGRYRWIDTLDERLVLYRAPWLDRYRHARPLWVDAPAHDPEVTPSMRRATVQGKESE